MSVTNSDPSFAAMIEDVAAYYGSRLAEHGTTARGVDWNGAASQTLRFAQFEKLLPEAGSISINDVGCGYGALFDYLSSRRTALDYCGTDISAAMIEAARERLAGRDGARFVIGSRPDGLADYGFASGIFNVRLRNSDAAWHDYLVATLDMICETSRNGFAFNCLTSYSDAEHMKEHLYYADPCAVFDLCKRRYSRQIALLHDYGLYEFTILVRKEA